MTLRNTRALVKLLYRDLDAGRAALKSLIEGVTVRPVDGGVEVTIRGTLGNVLSGWLTADVVIPFSGQKHESPDETREIVVCGKRGAGSPVFYVPHDLLRSTYRKHLHTRRGNRDASVRR